MMIQGLQTSTPDGLSAMKIEDFGELQARYQSMAIVRRAKSVLHDAHPALEAAQRIIDSLIQTEESASIFTSLRKNSLLVSKMRPSEARVALMDSSCDFLSETSRKLATWRRTVERISEGEAVTCIDNREYIRADEPLAVAIAGSSGLSNYLTIAQLALMEIAKRHPESKLKYASMIAQLRRCATVLSDYENACSFQAAVH